MYLYQICILINFTKHKVSFKSKQSNNHNIIMIYIFFPLLQNKTSLTQYNMYISIHWLWAYILWTIWSNLPTFILNFQSTSAWCEHSYSWVKQRNHTRSEENKGSIIHSRLVIRDSCVTWRWSNKPILSNINR